eukprot:1001421-Amorphochlora_amoeboformis.AAC.1
MIPVKEDYGCFSAETSDNPRRCILQYATQKSTTFPVQSYSSTVVVILSSGTPYLKQGLSCASQTPTCEIAFSKKHHHGNTIAYMYM